MPAINGTATIAAAARMYKASGQAAIPGYNGAIEAAPLWWAKKLVARNQNALNLFRQGLKQPCQYPVYRKPNQQPSLYLDEVALVQLLPLQARLYEESGQWRKAADSCLDGIELAARFNRDSGLICQLVGVLMVAIITDSLADVLDRCDGSTAAYLRDRLLKLYPGCGNTASMMREAKYEALVNLQSWANSNQARGRSGGGLGEQYLRWYYLLGKKTVLNNFLESQDAMARWAASPAWKRGALPVKFKDPVNSATLPLYYSCVGDTDKKLCRLRLVIVRAAIVAWRKSHTKAPDSLESLGLPPEIIRDSYRDGPFVYKPDVMRVYSVGLNSVDDGGDPELDMFAEERPANKRSVARSR
jgi:hypothetical protein